MKHNCHSHVILMLASCFLVQASAAGESGAVAWPGGLCKSSERVADQDMGRVNPVAFWHGFEDLALISGITLRDALPLYCTALQVTRVPLDIPGTSPLGFYQPEYEWAAVDDVKFLPDTERQDLASWYEYGNYDYWLAYSGAHFHIVEVLGIPASAIGQLSSNEVEAISLVVYFNAEELDGLREETQGKGGTSSGETLAPSKVATYFDSKTYDGAFNTVRKGVDFSFLESGTPAMYFAYDNKGIGLLRISGVVVTRRQLVSGLGEYPQFSPFRNAKYPDCYSIWLYCGRKPLVVDMDIMQWIPSPLQIPSPVQQ